MSFTFEYWQLIYTFCTLFVVFYLAYLVRIYLLSRQTGSRFNPVFYKFVLRLLYFSLFLFSLTGPRFGASKKEVPVMEKEIFLAIDLSNSMRCTDVVPSRFVRAKKQARELIGKLHNSKIGIIIFSADPFLHAPITNDVSALETLTEVLHPDLIESGGTDLGAVLFMAIEKFNRVKDQNQAKAIVLISDGEDFSESTEQAIKSAAEKDIRIYTLGIGTDYAQVPGQKVISALNRENLQKIAELTNGDYFEISKERNEEELIIKALNEWTGKKVTVKKADVKENRYFYFLLSALILMIADVLITINVIRL